MAHRNVAQTTQEIFSLLSEHGDDERKRIIDAVLTLMGVVPVGRPITTDASAPKAGPLTAEQYFAAKDPQSKIEELAVAAQFLEETSNADTHSKADLRQAVVDARRNFDDGNFRRDIDNAKTKGFFAKNREHDRYRLSYYGKQYISALPDRDTAVAIRKPKASGGRRQANPTKGS